MATDNFTRADENPLASPWATDSTFAKGVRLISNTAGNTASGDALSYRTDSTTLLSQITISAAGGFDGGPAICCNGAGNCYLINNSGGTTLSLYMVSGGSFNNIGSVGATYTAGHTYSLEKPAGSVIVKDNGATILTIADATYSSGAPGMHVNDTTIRFDDWTDNNAGGTDPTLTDVDSDEIVLAGQTGATITGTNLGATTSDRTLTFVQGGVTVTQTQTSGNATSGAFTVVMEPGGAALKFGAVTATVTRTIDSLTASLAVSVQPSTGQLYIDIGTPDSLAANRLTTSSDLASGDQVHARGLDGGAAPAGLTLGTDGTFYFLAGYWPMSFEFRVWDTSDQTWDAWATQTVLDVSKLRVKPSADSEGMEASFKDEITLKRWFD